jgi:hypothetical protein
MISAPVSCSMGSHPQFLNCSSAPMSKDFHDFVSPYTQRPSAFSLISGNDRSVTRYRRHVPKGASLNKLRNCQLSATHVQSTAIREKWTRLKNAGLNYIIEALLRSLSCSVPNICWPFNIESCWANIVQMYKSSSLQLGLLCIRIRQLHFLGFFFGSLYILLNSFVCYLICWLFNQLFGYLICYPSS